MRSSEQEIPHPKLGDIKKNLWKRWHRRGSKGWVQVRPAGWGKGIWGRTRHWQGQGVRIHRGCTGAPTCVTHVHPPVPTAGAPTITQFADPLVEATITVYSTITSQLLPTPAKSHYTFNLRDLSKVFQGILMADPAKVEVRIW